MGVAWRTLLLVAACAGTQSAASDPPAPVAAEPAWREGDVVEVDLWIVGSVDAWDAEADAATAPRTAAQIPVRRVRELLRCARVHAGRPVEAVAAYPEWAMHLAGLDASLEGAIVRYTADAMPPRWEVHDGRALTRTAREFLDDRLEHLDSFDSVLVRLAAASQPEDSTREPSAALLGLARGALAGVGMPGPKSRMHRSEEEAHESGKSTRIFGTLVPEPPSDPRAVAWAQGGTCHYQGMVTRSGEAPRRQWGMLLSQTVGMLRGEAGHSHMVITTWREFEVRLLAEHEGRRRAPPWPAAAAPALPQAARALASAVLDSAVRQRVYALHDPEGRTILPPGMEAADRQLSPLGGVAEDAPGVAAVPQKDGAGVTGWTWGFRPQADGAPEVRAWWLVPPDSGVVPQDPIGQLGLGPEDMQGGPWLVTTSQGAPLGWLSAVGLASVGDLWWSGRSAAMGRPFEAQQGLVTLEDPRHPWSGGVDAEVASLRQGLDLATAAAADLHRLARLELARGEVKAANEAMAALRAQWPSYARWVGALGRSLRRAAVCMAERGMDDLLHLRWLLEGAAGSLPSLFATLELASALAQAERPDPALAVFQAARDAGADPALVALGLANLHLQRKELPEMLAALDLQPAEDRDDYWLSLRCYGLVGLGRVEEAAALLEPTPLAERSALLLEATLRVLAAQKSYEAAREAGEALLARAPGEERSYYFVVRVLIEGQRLTDALAVVERGLARFPDSKHLREVRELLKNAAPR